MQRTIVLVDGGSAARAEVDEILGDAGYEAQTATSGVMALTMMRELEQPVVLVLDRRLPDRSAREFIAHLEEDTRLRGAVVVMMAGGNVRKGELTTALRHAFTEDERSGAARVPLVRRRARPETLRRRARRAPPA